MYATIHLMPNHLWCRSINLDAGQAAQSFKDGHYQKTKAIRFSHHAGTTPESIADECFDLTNHPGRQEERELMYGRGRSVSVGDIVEVEDKLDPEKSTYWLCMSTGWQQIEV